MEFVIGEYYQDPKSGDIIEVIEIDECDCGDIDHYNYRVKVHNIGNEHGFSDETKESHFTHDELISFDYQKCDFFESKLYGAMHK